MKKAVWLVFFFICPAVCFADTHLFGNTQIHGFLSQGFLKSTKNNYYYAETKDGTFEFNEAALTFLNRPVPNLRFGVQILVKDIGGIGNDKVVLDWVTADYRYRKCIGFRAGKMKLPFGLHNQSRDVDAARTFIFLPSSLYNENERETLLALKGAGIYGMLPAGLSYQAQYGLMEIRDDGGTIGRLNSGKFGQIFGKFIGTDIDPATSAQVMWRTSVDGLRFGLSFLDFGFSAMTATDSVRITGHRYVFSSEYVLESVTLTAEYLFGEDHVSSPSQGLTFPVLDAEGWYGAATFQLTENFEAGTYFSYWCPDTNNKSNDNVSKDLAIALRYDMNRYTILKLECHYINGVNIVDRAVLNPEKEGVLTAVRVTFYF